jgi:hypothetical protein
MIPDDVGLVGSWTDGAPAPAPAPAPAQDPASASTPADIGSAVAAGTTLLAGHVNHVGQGNGVLHDLYRIDPRATIYLTDRVDRVTRWQVVASTAVLKAELPASVFAGRSGPRRLVLVTCGGPIHHRKGHGWTYDDNVVVTATPS